MICPNCGKEIVDGSIRCEHCQAVIGSPDTGLADRGYVQQERQLSAFGWYLEVLRNYAVFSGRARRKEYWFFVLFNLLAGMALGFVDGLAGTYNESSGYGLLSTIYLAATFLPALAVTVRRYHDTNRSGWWVLIWLVPLVGIVVHLVFALKDSQPGSNQYGQNPKGIQA
ncbi:MAG: DUF805 domain-containing protein [Acidobacteriota bacterium]